MFKTSFIGLLSLTLSSLFANNAADTTFLASSIKTAAAVIALDYSPDGKRLVTGVQLLRNGQILTVGKDRTIKIWDANFKNIKNYIVESSVASIAVSSDQKMAALALGDGKTVVLDITTGLIKFQFDSKSKVKNVTFHPVEPLIVALYNDNAARSWLLR